MEAQYRISQHRTEPVGPDRLPCGLYTSSAESIKEESPLPIAGVPIPDPAPASFPHHQIMVLISQLEDLVREIMREIILMLVTRDSFATP